MPFNHTKLEIRLSECDERLKDLFNDVKISVEIKKHIEEVQNYYNVSYTNAKKDKTAEAIVTTYEEYLDHLGKVKNGTYSYTMGQNTYETALHIHNHTHDFIVYTNDSRQIDVFKHNLANVILCNVWVFGYTF